MSVGRGWCALTFRMNTCFSTCLFRSVRKERKLVMADLWCHGGQRGGQGDAPHDLRWFSERCAIRWTPSLLVLDTTRPSMMWYAMRMIANVMKHYKTMYLNEEMQITRPL